MDKDRPNTEGGNVLASTLDDATAAEKKDEKAAEKKVELGVAQIGIAEKARDMGWRLDRYGRLYVEDSHTRIRFDGESVCLDKRLLVTDQEREDDKTLQGRPRHPWKETLKMKINEAEVTSDGLKKKKGE